MSSYLPDSIQTAAATPSPPDTTPNSAPTTTPASNPSTGHVKFVLPPAGMYTTAQLPPVLASPGRQPTAASSTGTMSLQADEARVQMKYDLRQKICILEDSSNFWGKVLKTDSVPPACVDAILKDVKEDIESLCGLVNSQNSSEEKMYAPLAKIMGAIETYGNSTPRVTRFWKDYHTKYPGVDQDVYITGLERENEPEPQSSLAGETSDSRMSRSKRRKTGDATVTYTASSPEPDESDPEKEDKTYYPALPTSAKRKAPPAPTPEPQRFTDFRKPDLILLDGDSAGRIPKTPMWRQIAVIFELKIKPSNAPKKEDADSSLIIQCAEYARLRLALRPFQRFSIHFSLCGNLFNAWLIDRVGVIISDTVDISQVAGVETFIRALVQVTTNLTAYDLGMDPTVAIAEGCLGDKAIPRYAVSMPSNNVYITKGTPIWQSASLFGRGTMVWNVEEANDRASGTPSQPPSSTFILKTAYRNPKRIGESSFYEALQSIKIPGLAVFREGGDVKLKDEMIPSIAIAAKADEGSDSETGKTKSQSLDLSNRVHRKGLTDSYKPDSIAHRLVLESRGRRLSEHRSLMEVLEAVLENVKGHEALYNHGILHRDISIGNVFISDKSASSRGVAGFLGDLDMAKVYDPSKLATAISKEEADKLIPEADSGSVTGTAQFMALSLLEHNDRLQRAALNPGGTFKKPANGTKRWRDPTTSSRVTPNWDLAGRNDLESFIWVMLYAFCVKEMNTRRVSKEIGGRAWYREQFFVPLFGGVSFSKTHAAHLQARGYLLESDGETEWKSALVPDEIVWNLLGDLMGLSNAGDLNHTVFKEVLEHYISEEARRTPHVN